MPPGFLWGPVENPVRSAIERWSTYKPGNWPFFCEDGLGTDQMSLSSQIGWRYQWFRSCCSRGEFCKALKVARISLTLQPFPIGLLLWGNIIGSCLFVQRVRTKNKALSTSDIKLNVASHQAAHVIFQCLTLHRMRSVTVCKELNSTSWLPVGLPVALNQYEILFVKYWSVQRHCWSLKLCPDLKSRGDR